MALDPQVALRVLCGAWLLPHAVLKTLNAEFAQKTFAAVGLRPGKLFLFVTVAMEIAAAVGLVFDLAPKCAAALAVLVLWGATYAVVRVNGLSWRWNKQGIEYTIFWSIASIISVL